MELVVGIDQNLSHSSLDKASALSLSFDLTYLANTLVLQTSPSSMIILIKTIQFLHLDEELLIMLTTASLSQKSIIFLFLNSFN